MRFTPSTIIPSDFNYFDSYDLGGNEPGDVPFNTVACGNFIEANPVENFVDLGKCCICGTVFRYGEAWAHEPSGLRISIGHTCAEKYGLMASDADYQHKRASHIRKIQAKQERRARLEEMIAFLTDNPMVRVWLSLDHHITQDMKAKLERWGSLTPKQVDLLEKLYTDAQIERVEFPPMDIPAEMLEGRARVKGTIVGIKFVEGYGYSSCDITKMIVRIEDEGRAYKVYGTMPDALACELTDRYSADDGLKGIIRREQPVIAFDAKFEVSHDDKAFGFFKRPTKSTLLEGATV